MTHARIPAWLDRILFAASLWRVDGYDGQPTSLRDALCIAGVTRRGGAPMSEYERGRRAGRADVAKYSNAIERIESLLKISGTPPMAKTVDAVARLVDKVVYMETSTASAWKACGDWKMAAEIQNRQWSAACVDRDDWRARAESAESKLERVGDLLSANGCDCECEHDSESHYDGCELCLPCRIDEVIR